MAKHILNKDGSTTHKFDNDQEITIAPLPPEFSTGTPQKKGLESYTYFGHDIGTTIHDVRDLYLQKFNLKIK